MTKFNIPKHWKQYYYDRGLYDMFHTLKKRCNVRFGNDCIFDNANPKKCTFKGCPAKSKKVNRID